MSVFPEEDFAKASSFQTVCDGNFLLRWLRSDIPVAERVNLASSLSDLSRESK